MIYQAADRAAASGPIRILVRALAGLRAGILAGLLILGWILLATLVSGRPVWLIPNLLATLFYGGQSVRGEFGLHTCSGIALLLIQCAAVCIVWSLVASSLRGRFGVVLALVYTTAAWWIASNFWEKFNPHLLTFTPAFIISTGFLILAISLCLLPWQVRAMERKLLAE